MKNTDLKLLNFVIIGKFNDGKCRQILTKPETESAILSLITACESQIRVLDKAIEGIDVKPYNDEKDKLVQKAQEQEAGAFQVCNYREGLSG